MHNNRIDAGLFEQHNIARKLARQLRIAHSMAAIFYDHGFAVIALHEGQGLRQHMGLCNPVIRRCRFFCPVFYLGFRTHLKSAISPIHPVVNLPSQNYVPRL